MTKKDEYPLPQSEFVRLEFRKQSNAICIELWNEDRGDYHEPVSTQFGVVARLRCADDNDFYGLSITVKGMDGQRHRPQEGGDRAHPGPPRPLEAQGSRQENLSQGAREGPRHGIRP